MPNPLLLFGEGSAPQADGRATRLEASRTNHLTRSEELDHADWTASNVTVTADAATAPDGATTADNLSDTSASAHGFVSQAHTVADDSLDDAASVYFAKTATDHIAMVALEYTGGTTELTYEAEINLNGGETDVSNSPDAPTRVVVEDWGDFWRVSVVGANNSTGNTTATTIAYPHVGTTLGTRDVSVTGDVDVWGAQLEDGPFPSSYISTTTAAVTRAADDASESFTSSPQAMTVYVKFIDRGTGLRGFSSGIFHIGGPSVGSDPRFLVYSPSDTERYQVAHDNGTTVAAANAPDAPSIGDVVELAARLHSDGHVSIIQSINGAPTSSDEHTTTATLQASWADDVVNINDVFTDGAQAGFADFIAVTIESGVQTMDQMRSLADSKSGDLYSYYPGDPVDTFSRASAASYRQADDLLAEVASGVIRDLHYVDLKASISGTSAGTSADSATASTGALESISGTSAGTSTDTAAASTAKALTGTGAGASTDTATPTVSDAISATQAGVSTDTAAPSVTDSVTGTSAGTSADTGAATVTEIQSISGTGVGESADGGPLTAIVRVTATGAGTSEDTAAITPLGVHDITGTGEGTSEDSAVPGLVASRGELEVGTMAVALGSADSPRDIQIRAHPSNPYALLLGDSVDQTVRLEPGDAWAIEWVAPSEIFLRAETSNLLTQSTIEVQALTPEIGLAGQGSGALPVTPDWDQSGQDNPLAPQGSTAPTPVYRATVFEDLAMTTPVTPAASAPHSDEFKVATATGISGFQPYMGLPKGRNGRLDPIEARGDTGQITVPILDQRTTEGGDNAQRWATAFLGGTTGRIRQLGLPVRVEESLDGGSTWEDYYTGLVQRPKLDGRLWSVLEVRDNAERFQLEIFRGRPHPSVDYAHFSPLLPVGFVKQWDSVRRTPRLRAEIRHSRDLFWLAAIDSVNIPQPTDPAPLNIITAPLWELLNRAPRGGTPVVYDALRVVMEVTSGPRSGQEGHFWVGRAHAPREASERFSPTTPIDSIVGRETDRGHHMVAWLGLAEIDPSHPDYMPLDADIEEEMVELYVEASDPSGATDQLPLYVDDVHPATYIRDILDGHFGPIDDEGNPTEAFPYNASNLAAFEGDDSLPELRFVERERTKAVDKIEEICQSVGLGWRINDAGEFELIDLRLPHTFDLPRIDADDITTDAPEWEVDRDSALAQVQVVYRQDQVVPHAQIEAEGSEFPDVPAGAIESREQTFLKIDVSNPALLQGRPHEIDAPGYRHTLGAEENVRGVPRKTWLRGQLNTLTEHYRIPYGAGAPRVKITCRRTTPVESCRVGDLRIVDVDALPNPSLHQRGGQRIMRCVGRWPRGPAVELEFMDQALAQQADRPTLGTPSCGEVAGDVDVPVTLAASGDPAGIYFAAVDEGADKPDERSFAWIFSHRVTSSGTTTIPGVAGSNRIYVRARTEPDAGSDQGTSSDWVSPVGQEWVECGSLVAPTNCLGFSPTGVEVRLTWENTSFNRVAIIFEGVVQSFGLKAGTTSFSLIDTYRISNDSNETASIEPDTEYSFQIAYVDEAGNFGPTCGGTVTTADFVPRAPDLLGIRLLIGENVEIT